MSSLRRKRKQHDAEDFDDQVDGQDILQLMNIRPVTELPDDILLPGKLRQVQLRTSVPEGYHFEDVDEFHGEVLRTIEYLTDALHERDVDVTRIATEHDRAMVAIQNKAYENEFLSTQTVGATMEGAVDESLRIKIRDAEVEKEQLAQQVRDLEAQLVALRSGSAQAVSAADGNALSDEERAAHAELQAWAEQAEAAFAELSARNEKVEQEVERLKLDNERLRESLEASEQYSRDLDDYIDSYLPREGDEDGDNESAAEEPDNPSAGTDSRDAPAVHDDEYSPPESLEAPQSTVSDVVPDEEYGSPNAPSTQQVKSYRPRKDETPEERMERMSRELSEGMGSFAPELGDGITRTPGGYEEERVTPGKPLKSIPPGSDPNDYL